MNKQIEFDHKAKTKLLAGIEKLASAVISTLGPNGRNVILAKNEGGVLNPISTKDGVSVAKFIDLKDPIENVGAQMLKQASIKTANQAGDGTTTSTLLAYEMIKEGMSKIDRGVNVVNFTKGMENAIEQTLKYLIQNISEDITSEEQLQQIATISANNDIEVGKLIATSLEKVGREGIVTIEESRTGETYLETVEGMQLNQGYKSPYFVTDNNSMTSILNKAKILILDKKITNVKELLPLLESVSSQGKSLLIVAEDIEGEALATLIVNKMRGIINVAAIKAPDFGDRRKAIMEDLAIVTGGVVVSPDKGMRLDKFDLNWLGECRIANIAKDTTTIIDGKGDPDQINERITQIQSQIDNAKSPYEIEKLQDRLAKIIGGVAIIHVGGFTDAEIKERKDRVEDALHATRAAIEEGIVPGGGAALLYARDAITQTKDDGSDFNLGKQVVYRALGSPFINILSNAGFEHIESFNIINQIIEKGKAGSEPYYGFNIKTETIENMKDIGIIDPTKVVRNALQNSLSVAKTILLTEAVVYQEPSKDNQESISNDMGGMF